MPLPITPDEQALLARAARLRSSGSSWTQVALQLQTDPVRLEQLSFEHYRYYERSLRAADDRIRLEVRQEGMLCLRTQLRSTDPKIAQRAAT